MFSRPRTWAACLVALAMPLTLLPAALPVGAATPDYSSAAWVPADPSNYSNANRTHDYPIDMIVIHDIEGSAASAIQKFQAPSQGGSAHYVVSYGGQVTQMVQEHDIAWHAGNWDYNTRAIGIEHEGYAAYNYYTTAEYNASAALAASICSRYGVPLDRTHVIGHSEVPDPNNPGLFGGSDHHTDPGPYWNWSYYLATAQADAAKLPSLPHLMPDPVASSTPTGVSVTWRAARTCHAPITGYTVTAQPGAISQTLPATATSATFTNLQPGTRYTFTLTAQNAQGQDTLTTNAAVPGACTGATLSTTPSSPQVSGTRITLSAGSATCANPQYEFWMLAPGGVWTDVQPYSASATYTWDTTSLAYGKYSFGVWVEDANSPGVTVTASGNFDDRFGMDYVLTAPPCTTTTATSSPVSAAMEGTTVTVSATATGCSQPLYEFWLQSPNGAWAQVKPYSTAATYTWSTAGRLPGSYRFSVWARDAGSAGVAGTAPNTYDSFAAFPLTLTGGCPSSAASASPASSTSVGTTVTLSASATGCPSPRYEFWLLAPGGVWQIVAPYSTSSTFTWSTVGRRAGAYRFSVWVRNSGSSAPYDTFTAFPYTLTSTPCTTASATAAPATGAALGSTVTISGSAATCPNPQFQFYVLAPGGVWQIAQPYSASASMTWSTAGKPAGTYRISVWARDTSSAAAYDAFQAFDYTLTLEPCTGVTTTVTPAATAARGTTVSLSAVATGCPNPLYEFWVLGPGGVWTIARSYSPVATLTWSTTGRAAGTYRFSVWARDAGSGASYDTFQAFDYGLT